MTPRRLHANDRTGRTVGRTGRALVAGVVAAGSLAGALVVLGPAAGAATDPAAVLERARTATVREDFSGTVEVRWKTRGKWHSERTPVTATGGTVQVGQGVRQAEGQGHDRWVAGVSGWRAGWDEAADAPVPAPDRHWKLRAANGPEIAGRTTTVVTARDRTTGRPVLKEYVDRSTGVLLRRTVLDADGRPVRVVGFVAVSKLGGARSTPPTTPARHPTDARRTPAAVRTVPAALDAPASVADRYRLISRYRRSDGVTQLYYSDGLFGVSVFEQSGSLDRSSIPAGTPVKVSGADATTYDVAGGTVVVWDHDGAVRTVVSDLPDDGLVTFARSFDDRHDASGGWLHGVADFLLGPFGWR